MLNTTLQNITMVAQKLRCIS